MRIPVCGFEEDGKESGTTKDGVESKPLDEAVERPGTASCEVGPETVAPDVCERMFVRKWRNSTSLIFAVEGFVEEDEVCKSSPDCEFCFLKRLEVGL